MKLQFSHITKTGGSSLENAAFDSGVMWGINNPELWNSINDKTGVGCRDAWHLPLSVLNNDDLHSILKDYEFFTIVRNPYTRFISEYYCYFGSICVLKRGQVCFNEDLDVFNKNVNTALKRLPSILNWQRMVHWQPQYKYVFKDNIRIIDEKNIIKYETYNNSLKEFFKIQNLPLNKIKYHSTSKMVCQKYYDVSDLSQENISLINKIYYKDFKIFNYKMKKVYTEEIA